MATAKQRNVGPKHSRNFPVQFFFKILSLLSFYLNLAWSKYFSHSLQLIEIKKKAHIYTHHFTLGSEQLKYYSKLKLHCNHFYDGHIQVTYT